MGKKKGQQGGKHASQSFADMVGKANQEALKPFILQVIGDVGNDISRRVMAKMAILQNRVEALEALLIEDGYFDQVQLDSSLFDLEDKVTDYQPVNRPAQEGDLVRLTMRVKNTKTGWGKPTKKEFSNLGLPPYKMGLPEIEKVLLGVEVGGTANFLFENEELKKATGSDEIEFTIDRISEKIPKPEPVKEESSNVENQDAAQPSGSPAPEQVQPSSGG